MRTQDRIRAFELRAHGLTWDEIGEKLNYDGSTVSKAVHRVVNDGPRLVPLPQPLAEYLDAHCGGDLDVLARQLKISSSWIRKIFRGRGKPSPGLRAKIARITGLTEGEIFHD